MTEPEETVDVDNAVAVTQPSDWRSHDQPLSAVFHIPVSAVLSLSAMSLPARPHFHITIKKGKEKKMLIKRTVEKVIKNKKLKRQNKTKKPMS